MEELVPILIAILIVVLIVFGLGCFVQVLNITFWDNIPSEVWVDGNSVYKGSSAGFDVNSSGYATTVVIRGGFLYWFPQKVYTSKDVRIEGVKG